MMSDKQVKIEHDFYLHVCMVSHCDTYNHMHRCTDYTSAQADQASAECAYFFETGRLPPWAIIIERIEIIKDDYLIVHHDVRKAN